MPEAKTTTDQAALEAEILSFDEEGAGLADMSPEQLEHAAARIVRGHTSEAREMRRARKGVRYKLYRLRSEKEGKSTASDVATPSFRAHFEAQPFFKGWRQFASTWDVALDDPMRVVARLHTEQEEWDAVVAAKFPQVNTDGGVTYPDIRVRARVENEAARRDAAKG